MLNLYKNSSIVKYLKFKNTNLMSQMNMPEYYKYITQSSANPVNSGMFMPFMPQGQPHS